VTISELIAECEDYVRTEQFTRDLSSHILDMFLHERSRNECDAAASPTIGRPSDDSVVTNPFLSEPCVKCSSDAAVTRDAKSTNPFEIDFDDYASASTPQPGPETVLSPEVLSPEVPKFPFVHVDSRDSLYENGSEAAAKVSSMLSKQLLRVFESRVEYLPTLATMRGPKKPEILGLRKLSKNDFSLFSLSCMLLKHTRKREVIYPIISYTSENLPVSII
jgi:hypothetical protein